jgi:uncharacterized protein with HEPN domain
MSKLPEELLRHILDECNYLIDSSNDLTFAGFMEDETLQRAYSRSLEIIGEAVSKLPKDFLEKYKEIEWRNIAGMRNRLIHEYFSVDYELVWDVILNEIPGFREQIRSIIK